MSKSKKIKAILIRTNRYSDHSVMAKMYTREMGMQSMVIRGTGKSKKNKRNGLLQPLNILNLETWYHGQKNIHHVKEIALAERYISLHQGDLIKSSIEMFVNELIYKAIREEEENIPLFDFLHTSLLKLDKHSGKVVNFHLVFMLLFSRFLGFFPQLCNSGGLPYLDLQEGHFTSSQPLHSHYVEGKLRELFEKLLTIDYESMDTLSLSNQERKALLSLLIDYYSIHLQGLGPMKTPQVLESIFS